MKAPRMFLVAFVFLAAVLLAGCTGQNSNMQNTSISQSFTLQQVSQHSSPSDCWVAMGGKVYNLTEFISSSQFGKNFEQNCGTNATNAFQNRPSPSNGQDMNRRFDGNNFPRDSNYPRPPSDFNRPRPNPDGNFQRPNGGRNIFEQYYIGELVQ